MTQIAPTLQAFRRQRCRLKSLSLEPSAQMRHQVHLLCS